MNIIVQSVNIHSKNLTKSEIIYYNIKQYNTFKARVSGKYNRIYQFSLDPAEENRIMDLLESKDEVSASMGREILLDLFSKKCELHAQLANDYINIFGTTELKMNIYAVIMATISIKDRNSRIEYSLHLNYKT